MNLRPMIASLLLLVLTACKPDPAAQPDPDPTPVVPAKSAACAILSMSVQAGEWTLECEVDTLAGAVSLPYYEEDLTALKTATASVLLSPGASITPDPALEKDFRKISTFIVTAEDGTEKIYRVTPRLQPTPERPAKPVVMWVDAENSLQFLNTRSKVADVVQTAHRNGFSGIVMDVKSPANSDVFYTSEFLGYCTHIGKTDVPQDWDLLAELVDQCHRLGMTISASVSVMPFPRPASAKGQEYFDSHLSKAVTIEYLPDGFVSAADDEEIKYVLLNPAHPATHDYMIRMVSELARNYDLDGIALDYCRYLDIRSDFSDYSRSAFENWSGTPVENWPEDILKYSNASRNSYSYGPRIKEWVKWRSSVIQGCVRDCRDAIKAIKPSIKLEYWAEGWWWDCWMKGQNWASQSAKLSSGYSWAASDYMTTGFAEYLDIFHLGAYVHKVEGVADEYTMQYLCNYGKTRVLDACTLYGSFGAYVEGLDYSGATVFTYRNYPGMMIFELGSVRNRWGTYGKAIKRAMRLEGEYEAYTSAEP